MIEKIIWKLIRKVLLQMAGKIKNQQFFENLNQLTLTGLNIGGGSNPLDSGEKKALEYVYSKVHSQKNLVLLDVGANVGEYSILLKEVFGENAHIRSFEPSLKTFEKLTANIRNQPTIQLHNFGFGIENTRIPLYSDSEASGLASVYKRNLAHFNIDMKLNEEIEIKTLDSFCKDNNIDHIHFLKLDVEGHEIKVLEGASELLGENKIDFIQFEFGGCNIDSRTYFQDFYYLLKDKYTIYRIVKDGLYEIKKYKESYEAFITTNYLAERK
ncbi:FkbM family methyltransferase [Segetibacter koreensis]|uniref:FkbM family methyltransferase n=1 Tax=Segetibacter koreensis TaxID=398037 RepID=UPI00037EBF0D|nr:FkbM family methyltransferase [Segetibacter koreensis]